MTDDLTFSTQDEFAEFRVDEDENEFPGLVEVYAGQACAVDRDGLRRRIEDTFYSGDEVGQLYVVGDQDTLKPAFLHSAFESTDEGDWMRYRYTLHALDAPETTLASLVIRIDGRS